MQFMSCQPIYIYIYIYRYSRSGSNTNILIYRKKEKKEGQNLRECWKGNEEKLREEYVESRPCKNHRLGACQAS